MVVYWSESLSPQVGTGGTEDSEGSDLSQNCWFIIQCPQDGWTEKVVSR